MNAPDPPDSTLIERTRAAVLNVLVLVAAGIAASGMLLRWRDHAALWRGSEALRQTLLGALLGVVVASYLTRRVVASREALRDQARRTARFYHAHLLAAAIGALAIPLGLIYGWMIRPRLDAVIPFWVAAVALGLLALPRAAELEGFDPLPPASEEPKP